MRVMFSQGSKSSAWCEGAQAKCDGRVRESNPFKQGCKERDQWFKGWDTQAKS